MFARRSETYRSHSPQLMLGEVFPRLGPRERRWLLRSIVHELFHDRRIGGIALLGGSLFLLGIIFCIAGGTELPVPIGFAAGVTVVGAVLLSIGLHGWIKLVRKELVQFLLRLDRCGCCAHKKVDDCAGAHDRAIRGWTCSECGSTWWAGRIDRGGFVSRDAA
ncbi:MAG: hypothetical protein CMJ34_12045 [Phycisphaerae bacterium]|nr:hypothetical protein [Phycisphaerae bacterium]